MKLRYRTGVVGLDGGLDGGLDDGLDDGLDSGFDDWEMFSGIICSG